MQDTESLLKSELKLLTSIEIDELLKRFDDEKNLIYSQVDQKKKTIGKKS